MRKAGERELALSFDDGHESVFDVVELRRKCPCAQCVDEMSGRRMLRPESIGEGTRPLRIDPVGQYAITIHWSDGHSTGIYSFDYLRALCPCDACGGPGRDVQAGNPKQATRRS